MLLRFLKITLYALLNLALLVVVAVFALHTAPGREAVSGIVSTMIGRELRIDGPIGFTVFPATLTLRELSLEVGGRVASVEVDLLTVSRGVLRLLGPDEPAVELRARGMRLYLAGRGAPPERPDRSVAPPDRALILGVEDLSVFAGRGGERILRLGEFHGRYDPRLGAAVELHGAARRLPFTAAARIVPHGTTGGRAARFAGKVDYAGLAFRLNGDVGDYRDLSGLRIEIGMDDGKARAPGSEPPRPFVGRTARGRVDGDWGRLRLELDELTAHTEHGVVRLSALARQLDGGFVLERSEVGVEADDVGAMLGDFGVRSPLRGRLRAAASLSGASASGEIAVERIRASIGGSGVRVSGAGALTRQARGWRLALDLHGESRDLPAVISSPSALDWFAGAGTADATLLYEDGALRLRGLRARFDNESGILTGEASFDDLASLGGGEIRLEHRRGAAHGETAPGRLTLEVSLPAGWEKPGRLAGRRLLRDGEARIDATVAEFRTLSGIEGTIDYVPRRVGDAPVAGGIAGTFRIDRLRDGAFEVSGRMIGGDGRFEYRGIAGDDGASAGRLAVSGLGARAFAGLLGFETALASSFAPSLDLRASLEHDGGGFALRDVDARFGDSDLRGEIEVRFARSEGENPRVRMRSRSDRLVLKDIGFDSASPEDRPRDYYFSAEPLHLETLRLVDLELDVEADRVVSKALEYQALRLKVRGANGVVSFDSRQRLLGGGTANVGVFVDARGTPPLVSLKSDARGIDPGELRALQDDDEAYAGNADIELTIVGSGDSVREILSNADGWFLFRINDAVIPDKRLRLLSADFLLDTIRLINPFSEKSGTMGIGCGIVAFRIDDGVAVSDRHIVINGDRLLIVGEGTIDLGAEKVDLMLRPKARKGIGLSATNVVKEIGIGGTLVDPRSRTDAKSLLLGGASVGAALATGGLSLFFQTVFDRIASGFGGCGQVEEEFRASLLPR